MIAKTFLATVLLLSVVTYSHGQSSPAAAQQKSRMPQWQIDAGGRMAFDVASVKQNTAPPSPSTRHVNMPLGGDAYTPTGGLFYATNFTLFQYIVFAYKLTSYQGASVRSQLPKWANSNRYDLQGRRTSANVTKDQFRLMMQSLLADRFRLLVHYETKRLPALALVVEKPGKLGPQMKSHSEESPCSATLSDAPTLPTVPGGFPEICGTLIGWATDDPPGRVRAGARNVPVSTLVNEITDPITGIDRPVSDKTGLTGQYDFVIEFTPQFVDENAPPGFQPDRTGPTFLEALKEQLGLKLAPTRAQVDVLVIDHVEEPSPN